MNEETLNLMLRHKVKEQVDKEEAEKKSQLQEAMRDFVESCYSSGCFDQAENVSYFAMENNHLSLEKEDIVRAYEAEVAAYEDLT